MGVSVNTSIEIAAPPSIVQAVFYDFSSWPKWAKSQLQSVSLKDSPSGPNSTSLEVGSKLRIRVQGMSFTGTVSCFEPSKFQWRGGWNGVFVGEHTFRFEESKITPGATTFVNGEVFSGVLTLPFKGMTGPKDKDGKVPFDGFNEELKRRVESLQQNQE